MRQPRVCEITDLVFIFKWFCCAFEAKKICEVKQFLEHCFLWRKLFACVNIIRPAQSLRKEKRPDPTKDYSTSLFHIKSSLIITMCSRSRDFREIHWRVKLICCILMDLLQKRKNEGVVLFVLSETWGALRLSTLEEVRILLMWDACSWFSHIRQKDRKEKHQRLSFAAWSL